MECRPAARFCVATEPPFVRPEDRLAPSIAIVIDEPGEVRPENLYVPDFGAVNTPVHRTPKWLAGRPTIGAGSNSTAFDGFSSRLPSRCVQPVSVKYEPVRPPTAMLMK